MAFFQAQPNMLSLLHYQHRLYMSELGKSHRDLGKLYKKLERTERGLAEWKDRGLKRTDKKKLQWDRATTKSAVKHAESEQALLHDYLNQCGNLIASYTPTFFQGPPAPWAMPLSPLSPTAHTFEPNSPIPPTPWTAGPFEERTVWDRRGPQYWDLSMLHERQASTTSNGPPDSGYYHVAGEGVVSTYEHVANTEDTMAGNQANLQANGVAQLSHRLSISEKDALSELALSSSVKLGAEGPKSGHQRHYSEDAIQMIESRLGMPRVESRQSLKRTASETIISKE